jgi:hypothetical protein
MNSRRWNYNCELYYYYQQHFTFVRMDNLPVLFAKRAATGKQIFR